MYPTTICKLLLLFFCYYCNSRHITYATYLLPMEIINFQSSTTQVANHNNNIDIHNTNSNNSHYNESTTNNATEAAATAADANAYNNYNNTDLFNQETYSKKSVIHSRHGRQIEEIPKPRIIYQVGHSEKDLPVCKPFEVCSKIDLYDEPWLERHCRCPATKINDDDDDGDDVDSYITTILTNNNYDNDKEYEKYFPEMLGKKIEKNIIIENSSIEKEHQKYIKIIQPALQNKNDESRRIFRIIRSDDDNENNNNNNNDILKQTQTQIKSRNNKYKIVYQPSTPPHTDNNYNHHNNHHHNHNHNPNHNHQHNQQHNHRHQNIRRDISKKHDLTKLRHHGRGTTLGDIIALAGTISASPTGTGNSRVSEVVYEANNNNMGGCSTAMNMNDGHTIVDKTKHYKLCEKVISLRECDYFKDYTWTIQTYPNKNITQQIVHCKCPKNSVTYLTTRKPMESDNESYTYYFACSPPTQLSCERKKPCILFTVRKRPEVMYEVTTNSLCQCQNNSRCPRHHFDATIVNGSYKFVNGIRTYSGYCKPE